MNVNNSVSNQDNATTKQLQGIDDGLEAVNQGSRMVQGHLERLIPALERSERNADTFCDAARSELQSRLTGIRARRAELTSAMNNANQKTRAAQERMLGPLGVQGQPPELSDVAHAEFLTRLDVIKDARTQQFSTLQQGGALDNDAGFDVINEAHETAKKANRTVFEDIEMATNIVISGMKGVIQVRNSLLKEARAMQRDLASQEHTIMKLNGEKKTEEDAHELAKAKAQLEDFVARQQQALEALKAARANQLENKKEDNKHKIELVTKENEKKAHDDEMALADLRERLRPRGLLSLIFG
jgi:hypothetical protein